MGAGNPIIRSLDGHYDPTTYFLDFSDCYSDKEAAVKEMCEANEIDFSKLSEDEINEHFNRIIEWDTESFQDDYFFNLDEKEMIADWEKPNRDQRYLSECSGSFRGSAVILAMNKDTYLLITDEAESYHYPFGIIPRFNYEDIAEELYDLHIDKQDWYERRNMDYSARIEDLAEREYEKCLDKWRKKYEPFMRKFYEHHKNIMSERNGPWMSTSLSMIGKDYKFL